MAKMKKGQKLVCVQCGRELVVDSAGASETIVWCCSKPMNIKANNVKKVSKKQTSKKKSKK